MANDEVDPETFFLETWDIVQLPAVKKARLTMCESLQNTRTLSKALRESLEQMTDEDRAEAEATLERLDVSVEDEDMYPDIPWAPGEEPLIEETEEIEAVLTDEEKPTEPTEPNKPDSEESSDEKPVAASDDKQILKEEAEDEEAVDDDEEDIEKSETVTIKDFVELFKDYDQDLKLEFDSIEVNEGTIAITELVLDDEIEDGKVIVSFNYNLETSDNTEDEKDESKADEESSPKDAEQPEVEDAFEEAIDDGEDEVIESLKDMFHAANFIWCSV